LGVVERSWTGLQALNVAAGGGGGGGEEELPARNTLCIFFSGEIVKATRGFDASMWLGAGGFGKVFKGSGFTGFSASAEFAIKVLDPDSLQGQCEFLQELQVLGGCRHENLLPLVGCPRSHPHPAHHSTLNRKRTIYSPTPSTTFHFTVNAVRS